MGPMSEAYDEFMHNLEEAESMVTRWFCPQCGFPMWDLRGEHLWCRGGHEWDLYQILVDGQPMTLLISAGYHDRMERKE